MSWSFIYLFKTFYFYFWLRWIFVGCARAFSGCGERGLLFVALHGLIAVSSVIAEHGL